MLEALIDGLIIIIALEHIGFMVLEMWFWDKPLGRRIFRLEPSFAQASRVLAANQGLYNGFLAAGLLWAVYDSSLSLKLFFLICVFIAAVFGGATVGRKIFWIQGLPALAALFLIMIVTI